LKPRLQLTFAQLVEMSCSGLMPISPESDTFNFRPQTPFVPVGTLQLAPAALQLVVTLLWVVGPLICLTLVFLEGLLKAPAQLHQPQLV
jgi:hypothetical protein